MGVSSNSFGKLFTVTTFGESHGPAIGCVIDGCPPGLEIAPEEFSARPHRRATGTSKYTSQRHEADDVEILSGVFEGKTTGTPIALLIRNTDARSKDYARNRRIRSAPATPTTPIGRNTASAIYRGGGRSSARETTMRVAAGVIAKKWLAQKFGVRRARHGSRSSDALTPHAVRLGRVDANPFFWPDAAMVTELESYMDALRKSGDSVGARVNVVAEDVPPGWGEPIYGKLDGELAVGDDVDQRGQGRRDRRRLSRRRAKRQRTSRRNDAAGIPVQPRRRHSRRHFDRSGHRRLDGVEADIEHFDSRAKA